MENINQQNRYRASLKLYSKDKEGNPTQKDRLVSQEGSKLPLTSPDQELAHVVKQAIKDDQGLASVSKDINVTVTDGAITLDGEVSTEQQMNLAANTAMALGVVNHVDNRMEVTHINKKPVQELAKDQSLADDDGFVLPDRIRGVPYLTR